ncbi:DNA-processing protein DprA [Acinetobacter sp. MD2(2019)]|uniref:DNA-processing protein DprA n=1 Tax=Acinetobacter sp. MD2(2019) TaxID=2605273 RepID=UPI002D1F70B3|nr:DNA-processing protein DprA [Acinetobacter sp. MD2(2019)]MEB3754928.1 DNA-protecting protein DprA [Acinetobacter sp. MD2(2019)]
MLNQISNVHLHCIQLWYLVQHSYSAYQKLVAYFGNPEQATSSANLQRWGELNIHANHIQRAKEFQSPEQQQKFAQILQLLQQHCDFICTEQDTSYPPQLLPYEDRPPILFGQGHVLHLSQPQVAIVGSRKASSQGLQIAYDFAYYLAEKGFYITSGLALGIDAAAHSGGLHHHRTIAVMGTGIEQTYPPAHLGLREKILAHDGIILTEFLPQTPPLARYFPRRNRIVSGLSLGVIVAEATLKSGSILTAQAAAIQGKTIFAIPGHIYQEQNKGCHQLIREGAILIDHPEQVIEDLALPTQWQMQQHNGVPLPTPEIPEHLLKLYQQLDWVGSDLDQLAARLERPAHELSAHLMELELLGLCLQQAGRYSRCHSV